MQKIVMVILANNNVDPFSVFENEIITIISNNIKTDNIEINGTVYPKNDILQKIHITLLIQGVTIAQIQSGNVNNMIGIFYGENSNENLTPIYNSTHRNSWDVYSFTPITDNLLKTDDNYWEGNLLISSYLFNLLNVPYNFTSSTYTAQECFNALWNWVASLPYNKEIIDSISNSIMNYVSNLIPNKLILSGMIITKDEIFDNLNWNISSMPQNFSGNQLCKIEFVFHFTLSNSTLLIWAFTNDNGNLTYVKPKKLS